MFLQIEIKYLHKKCVDTLGVGRRGLPSTIGTLKGQGVAEVQKTLSFSHTYKHKQSPWSIDMKTKVVQHVPRIIFNVFKVFRFQAPV